jgi:hypothetical protein
MLMSEGIAPMQINSVNESQLPEAIECWMSDDNRIKFYMAVDAKPQSDWLLTLKGRPYTRVPPPEETLSVWVFANNQTVGHWVASVKENETTLRIPKRLLEESFNDPTGLFTLMLRIPKALRKGGVESPLGLQLEGLYLRPAESSVDLRSE